LIVEAVDYAPSAQLEAEIVRLLGPDLGCQGNGRKKDSEDEDDERSTIHEFLP
jgi:hypothetical protein